MHLNKRERRVRSGLYNSSPSNQASPAVLASTSWMLHYAGYRLRSCGIHDAGNSIAGHDSGV